MNYCQKGREMLLDLKRAEFLPAYDDEGMRLITNELSDIHGKLTTVMQEHDAAVIDAYPDDVKVCLSYYHQCITRNRRYINRYFKYTHGLIIELRNNACSSHHIHNQLSDAPNRQDSNTTMGNWNSATRENTA